MSRISGVERELGGRRRDQFLDERALEPDPAVGPIDACAGGGETIDRAVAENLDPDLLDVVGGQDLERRERVREGPERELLDAPATDASSVASMGDGLDGQAPRR